MSQTLMLLKQIEGLNTNELANALEFNGYAECVGAIHSKNIDGQEFLRLTELQISLWRLPPVHARRLWSFIQQIKEDPKQFLMNIEKTTAKFNKSKFASDSKPFISEKPSDISSHFQKAVQLSEKDEMIQKENTETNFSTLSKQRSKELKNKLELVFRKEASEVPNSSFVYSKKQPQLPPKPDHLKLENIENLERSKQIEEEENDFNDGYLSPINKRKSDTIEKENERSSANISRSNSNTTTTSSLFLNKFRKGYENLEIRPAVVENKYEEQTVKPPKPVVQERPLPPIPKQTEDARPYKPNVSHETDDEELAHYVSVLEESDTTNKGKTNSVTRKESFNRPLPEIPIRGSNEFLNSKQSLINNHNVSATDDEELAEYSSVVEEEEEIKTSPAQSSKNYSYHRPLPPVPIPSPPIVSINEIPPILIPHEFSKTATVTPHPPITMQHQVSAVKLKPRAELPKSPNTPPKFSENLPKPPANLPRPPLEIVPPNLLLAPQNEFSSTINPDETHVQQRHSPVLSNVQSEQNISEEIEESFYTEIDLATVPSYRETDRKGARRLLSGLEDGAFLIRPSRQSEFVCTLSIRTTMKMYNLGVEKKSDGTFAFSSVEEDFEQPKLYSIGELIEYYKKIPIYLSGEYILLKDVVPRSRH